ncbi:MAG: class I SAM-dependent methyltransferase, partial [Phycisphaeraceae bacterium]|nr:class I SAM-dependent methyltransferase [Phycisphaeraceae bacterium]
MGETPACLACGGDVTHWADARDVEYYSVPDTFGYYQCGACKSLSISPVPENRLGEIYPSTYYSFNTGKGALSLATKIKLALDRRLFKSLFRRIGDRQAYSALDVGGGTGWLLEQAKQAEPKLKRTMVVDIDAQARDTALKAGHEYFHGRIEDFATDDKFDLVLMLNLIEHVKDPVGMLKKAGDMLSGGGLILIKTPNYDALDARLFRHKNWGGYHCPRHWVLFSPDSFRQAAEKAGLKVEELKLTQGAPFWAVSVIHWLKEK